MSSIDADDAVLAEVFVDDGVLPQVFAETTGLPLDDASVSSMTNLIDGCREESPLLQTFFTSACSSFSKIFICRCQW